MNNKNRIRKELENDIVWKNLCASATPEQLSQVNDILDEFLSAAGVITDNFASSVSSEKITDEQVAAAINDN